MIFKLVTNLLPPPPPYFMNYSRHLLCDVHQYVLPATPPVRGWNYRRFLYTSNPVVNLKPRKTKKGTTLIPDTRTVVIRKFPSLIPFFKTVFIKNTDQTAALMRKPWLLQKVWSIRDPREDLTHPEYSYLGKSQVLTKDPSYNYVDDRLTFTKTFPEGAFFQALLKKVGRHVVQESVEDTTYKFVGEDALYRRFSAYSFRNYMVEERTHFSKVGVQAGCVKLTEAEEVKFDLWSLALLYETWIISERRFPRNRPLTELELIDTVFAKLEMEIKRRALANDVGGYRTELLALEQVRQRIRMLSELLHLLLHRSPNRSIFMHISGSTSETNKKDPAPIYKFHYLHLDMFDINFLKREKVYTKLKYSRSPAYDIVSGGVAALFAGFLGFLISEKFGIELVDSGDFYTLFMYIVFLTFSTKPLMKIMTQGKLTNHVWSFTWFKYYLDSLLWVTGSAMITLWAYLPHFWQLSRGTKLINSIKCLLRYLRN